MSAPEPSGGHWGNRRYLPPPQLGFPLCKTRIAPLTSSVVCVEIHDGFLCSQDLFKAETIS